MKKVPSGNKGLGKLPTSVRNKMGYMKKGGTIASKKAKGMNKGGVLKKAKGMKKGGVLKAKGMKKGGVVKKAKGMKRGGARTKK
jgi:hypothetical protein